MPQITPINTKEPLLYADLSYKVIGIVYKVYNALGYGYKEKEYQKAIANELESNQITFQRELYSNVKYNGELLTKFYLDFLIDNKIVLETKIANQVYKKHFSQVLQYLKSNNLKLGIIVVFTPDGIITKRIINEKEH